MVSQLEQIRVVWNLYRFGIKITNNFFTNLSPFLIFILGGYLAINGQLELGSLVAFLSAQEKIFDPWRELIDFYQAYQDASVSYNQTMRYFEAYPESERYVDPERETFRDVLCDTYSGCLPRDIRTGMYSQLDALYPMTDRFVDIRYKYITSMIHYSPEVITENYWLQPEWETNYLGIEGKWETSNALNSIRNYRLTSRRNLKV